MFNVVIYGCRNLSDIQQTLVLNCMSENVKSIINDKNCFITVVVPKDISTQDLENLQYLGTVTPDVYLKEDDIIHALRLIVRNRLDTVFIRAGEIVEVHSDDAFPISEVSFPNDGMHDDSICGWAVPAKSIESFLNACKSSGILKGDIHIFKYFLEKSCVSKTKHLYDASSSCDSADDCWCDGDTRIDRNKNKDLLLKYYERNPNMIINGPSSTLEDIID